MRKPKMRKLLYLMLIVVLALVVGWRVFVLVDDDDEDGNAPVSTTEQTTPALTTEQTWPEYRTVKDVPIYPGARDHEQFLDETIPYPSIGQYKKVGWDFFSTDDDVAKVNSFYEDTMPDHGWEGSASMSPGAAKWTFWQTKDLERGAAIILVPKGSETILTIWLGEGYIPPPPPESQENTVEVAP